MAALKSALPLVSDGNPIPYQYSYYLDRHKEVTAKLGLPAPWVESPDHRKRVDFDLRGCQLAVLTGCCRD